MIKDLPDNKVENIGIAVILEEETSTYKVWNVYIINFKKIPISTVLVSSKGYGTFKGDEVKTSVLRHALGDMDANSYAFVEAIDDKLFAINNEYLVSYYIDGTIYDKKFIFLTESITEFNFIRVPLINKPGVLIA